MLKYVLKVITSGNEEDNNTAKTSVIIAQAALSVCSQHARVLVHLLTCSFLPGHITNNWLIEHQPDTPKLQRGC